MTDSANRFLDFSMLPFFKVSVSKCPVHHACFKLMKDALNLRPLWRCATGNCLVSLFYVTCLFTWWILLSSCLLPWQSAVFKQNVSYTRSMAMMFHIIIVLVYLYGTIHKHTANILWFLSLKWYFFLCNSYTTPYQQHPPPPQSPTSSLPTMHQ